MMRTSRRLPSSRRGPVVKLALYGFLLLVCALLQMSVLPAWRIAEGTPFSGVHPLWLPVLAVLAAVREGEWFGLGYGLAAGLLSDLLTPRSGGFYTVFIMAACVLACVLCERVLTRRFAVAFLWALSVFAVMDMLYFTLFYLLPGRAGWAALGAVALPETLFSVASGIWMYFPVKWISKIR